MAGEADMVPNINYHLQISLQKPEHSWGKGENEKPQFYQENNSDSSSNPSQIKKPKQKTS